MRLEITEDAALTDTEIRIRCPRMDEKVSALVAAIRIFDYQLTGTLQGETYLLNARDLLYIDTVDKRTFLYAAKATYETNLRLYALEERLYGCGFFRAGKSLIINFNQIKSLRPDFGGRMRITMQNGEICMVSRQYVGALKEKLGLKQEG